MNEHSSDPSNCILVRIILFQNSSPLILGYSSKALRAISLGYKNDAEFSVIYVI